MSDKDTGVGPIGGQALIEGVMMRRGECWGAAVRCEDGSIATTKRDLPPGIGRWRSVPLVRGVIALAESTGLGTKAMIWAAQERTGEDSDDGFSKGGLAASTVIAVTLALGLFGIMPAAIAKLAGIENPFVFSTVEGMIRLGVLVGYLLLLSMSPSVRRVFAYHGAEHMTIHAFEHQVALVPAEIRKFSRRHPRCGTAFLLIVVAVTILSHALVADASWGVLVLSRILSLPIVAAVSYEAVRFAGLHQETRFGRILMAPGSWLQGITTREPDDDMIEVAVAALEATLEAPVEVTSVPVAVAAA